MKYDKEELKEKAIKLYLEGKKMQDIANILKCSRNYVGTIIKNDERIKQYRNKKVVKVFKYKNVNKMNIPISTDFLKKIGISNNIEQVDFVELQVDEEKKIITIKKY